jgi:D-3-phosphoglycerate dehydrogenase
MGRGPNTMTARFRVLLTDRAWPDCDIERDILSRVDAEIIEAPDGNESTLVELARDVDAIATCWANVTGDVIRAANGCQVVSRFGIGLDNIDVETASALGIPITYVPDYCVPEVSDHALALLLGLARKVAFYHQATKVGRYNLQAGPPMHRLAGRVLGLVGFGRIAQALRPKALALGLKVVAYSPSGNDYGTSCEMVSLEDLLALSDFISLHAPLSDQTSKMFGAAQFEAMQPTAYLVNTSRGGLIDHEALLDALQSGKLAGAALDVFDPEPPDLSQPLYCDERVIVTPHAGFLSAESLVELRTRTATQIAQALQGERPEQVVNPHVYDNRH